MVAPDLSTGIGYSMPRAQLRHRLHANSVTKVSLVALHTRQHHRDCHDNCRRNTRRAARRRLAQVAPYAYFDPVVRNTFQVRKAKLDRRASEKSAVWRGDRRAAAATPLGQPASPDAVADEQRPNRRAVTDHAVHAAANFGGARRRQ